MPITPFMFARASAVYRASVTVCVRLEKRSSPGSAPTSWLLRTNPGDLAAADPVAAFGEEHWYGGGASRGPVSGIPATLGNVPPVAASPIRGGPAGGAYAMRYTRAVAKTVPVREFRTKLSEFLSDVADRRDHVLVTRNGKPAAALVPIDEYEALEETAEILSDSATLAAIEAGVAELARDETITLTALRAELAERRALR